MTSQQEFQPNWVSAPGETIVDVLIERGMSEADFGRRIGESPEAVRYLLEGRKPITLSLARNLEYVLGASVEFWMSRDYQYRENAKRIGQSHQEWLSELPVRDMINFGWIQEPPRPENELDACLDFFDVSSVDQWHREYGELSQMTAFRTSPSFDSRPAALAAWLRQGEIEAESVQCASWDPDSIRRIIPEIRSLTRQKDPSRFIPILRGLCCESGIALTIVRTPSGCHASGATRFIRPGKPLLQLSFRYLSDDHFWFSLFHELGHLLLHDPNKIFLEGIKSGSMKEEGEANEFAANTLIPPEFQSEFARLKASHRNVVKFAVKIGIAPGIVVGQLQHRKMIGYDELNRLKRRYAWDE